MSEPEQTPARQIRQENYAIKAAAAFQCARCGSRNSVLAVDVKNPEEGEPSTTTRCEGCLDRRSFDVRPHQFDEADRLREALRAKGA